MYLILQHNLLFVLMIKGLTVMEAILCPCAADVPVAVHNFKCTAQSIIIIMKKLVINFPKQIMVASNFHKVTILRYLNMLSLMSLTIECSSSKATFASPDLASTSHSCSSIIALSSDLAYS